MRESAGRLEGGRKCFVPGKVHGGRGTRLSRHVLAVSSSASNDEDRRTNWFKACPPTCERLWQWNRPPKFRERETHRARLCQISPSAPATFNRQDTVRTKMKPSIHLVVRRNPSWKYSERDGALIAADTTSQARHRRSSSIARSLLDCVRAHCDSFMGGQLQSTGIS